MYNKKPNRVLEFGALNGYSTVCIGQALRDVGYGTLVSYDLFEDYPYNNSNYKDVLTTIREYGLNEIIDFGLIMILSLSLILMSSFSILPLLISYFPDPKNSKNIKFTILEKFYSISKNHSNKIIFINIIEPPKSS